MAIEVISRMSPDGMMIEIVIPDKLLVLPRYMLWAELIDQLRRILFDDARKERE